MPEIAQSRPYRRLPVRRRAICLFSEPTNPHVCHCRMCQKAFGGYFAPLAGVPLGDFAWIKGTPGVFQSSEAVERGFCRDCGTPLFFRYVDKDRISRVARQSR